MLVKFRDMQVAEDISKKAALGWFDTEFTMYGCAYWEKGKMYYKISPEAEDIYDFIDKSALKEIYPSNIMVLSRKLPVPIGMKETVALTIKQELAKELQKTHCADFFKTLYDWAKKCETDTAAAVLWEEADRLEGLFEREKLNGFERLVNYCYSCRRLSKETYQKLSDWLKSERKSMNDDFISKDIFEKDFYGIAYEEKGTIQYLENAHKSSVFQKSHELEIAGDFVTPIFARKYWYNYEYSLPQVKKDFRAALRQEYNEAMMCKIKALRANADAALKTAFEKTIDDVRITWGDKPAETFSRYGQHWGIV